MLIAYDFRDRPTPHNQAYRRGHMSRDCVRSFSHKATDASGAKSHDMEHNTGYTGYERVQQATHIF